MAGPLNEFFFDFIILNNPLEKNFTKFGDILGWWRKKNSKTGDKNKIFSSLRFVTKILPIK